MAENSKVMQLDLSLRWPVGVAYGETLVIFQFLEPEQLFSDQIEGGPELAQLVHDLTRELNQLVLDHGQGDPRTKLNKLFALELHCNSKCKCILGALEV